MFSVTSRALPIAGHWEGNFHHRKLVNFAGKQSCSNQNLLPVSFQNRSHQSRFHSLVSGMKVAGDALWNELPLVPFVPIIFRGRLFLEGQNAIDLLCGAAIDTIRIGGGRKSVSHGSRLFRRINTIVVVCFLFFVYEKNKWIHRCISFHSKVLVFGGCRFEPWEFPISAKQEQHDIPSQ